MLVISYLYNDMYDNMVISYPHNHIISCLHNDIYDPMEIHVVALDDPMETHVVALDDPMETHDLCLSPQIEALEKRNEDHVQKRGKKTFPLSSWDGSPPLKHAADD